MELSISDLLEQKARGVSPMHLDRLEALWVKVLALMPDADAAGIGYEQLRAFEGARRAAGVRGQTIVRELQAIRRALLIAKRRKLIADLPEPWPTIRRDPKDKRRAGKLWPPELLAAWLRLLHDDARDEVEFCLRTGLRREEVKRVEAGWVEPAPTGSPTPYLLRIPDWAAKGRRERVAGLTEAAAQIIRRRVGAEPRHAQVFAQANFRKHRESAARKLGYPTTPTLRDLRHTFGTLALAATGDAAATMEALGHRDLRTTAIYQSSTLARTAAAAAGVDRVLLPEHFDRSTEMAAADNPAILLERATRLELATLSLGNESPSRKWLQNLAADVDAERNRTGRNASQPEHRTGARKVRR